MLPDILANCGGVIVRYAAGVYRGQLANGGLRRRAAAAGTGLQGSRDLPVIGITARQIH